MQIINSDIQFKFRTITPQSTTDDSGNLQHRDNSQDQTHTQQSLEDANVKKAVKQLIDEKPSTTAGANDKNLRVTKRLRQGTGESAKMRSSHYEHLKEAAKNSVS